LVERPLRQPSAELLGQCDDDALGAADVTEPIAVLVLLQAANEWYSPKAEHDFSGLNAEFTAVAYLGITWPWAS
jgi:hypothetical protein